jgi:hypothetical protein
MNIKNELTNSCNSVSMKVELDLYNSVSNCATLTSVTTVKLALVHDLCKVMNYASPISVKHAVDSEIEQYRYNAIGS